MTSRNLAHPTCLPGQSAFMWGQPSFLFATSATCKGLSVSHFSAMKTALHWLSEKILLISKVGKTARVLGGYVQEDTASEKDLEGQTLAKDMWQKPHSVNVVPLPSAPNRTFQKNSKWKSRSSYTAQIAKQLSIDRSCVSFIWLLSGKKGTGSFISKHHSLMTMFMLRSKGWKGRLMGKHTHSPIIHLQEAVWDAKGYDEVSAGIPSLPQVEFCWYPTVESYCLFYRLISTGWYPINANRWMQLLYL